MMLKPLTSVLTVAFALAASSLSAQPALPSTPASVPRAVDRVKQLYESAAYDEALAALDQLESPDAMDRPVASEASKAWHEYRALCLIALDRTPSAEQVIEQLLAQDPFYWPRPTDTSPRFVSLVDRARQRVFPLLARRQYESAKRDFDERRNAEAAAGFARVVALLGHPAFDRSAPGSSDDLRTLAAGFLELSRATAAPAPPPAAEGAPRVYGAEDPDVMAAVTVKQDLPAWNHGSFGVARRFEGQLDLVIDEAGNVESVTIVKSIFAGYDELAVAGAKEWKYSPATRLGVPVKFRKSVSVQLSVQ